MINDTQKSSHSVQDITDIRLEKTTTTEKTNEDPLTQLGQHCNCKKGSGWEALCAFCRDER